MKKVNVNQVLKTYNGKQGCMCGCRGKYSVMADADVGSGYSTFVSPRSVKIAVNKINAGIDDKTTKYDDDARCYYLDDNGRSTVVYIK